MVFRSWAFLPAVTFPDIRKTRLARAASPLRRARVQSAAHTSFTDVNQFQSHKLPGAFPPCRERCRNKVGLYEWDGKPKGLRQEERKPGF